MIQRLLNWSKSMDNENKVKSDDMWLAINMCTVAWMLGLMDQWYKVIWKTDLITKSDIVDGFIAGEKTKTRSSLQIMLSHAKQTPLILKIKHKTNDIYNLFTCTRWWSFP